VGWVDVLTAVTLELCSVLLVLASGLVGTSMAEGAGRAFAWAELTAVVMAVFLETMLVGTFARLITFSPPIVFPPVSLDTLVLMTGLGLNGWSPLVGMPGSAVCAKWLLTLGICLLASIGLFSLSLLLAARLLRRTWQMRPPSAAALRRKHCWFAPRVHATPTGAASGRLAAGAILGEPGGALGMVWVGADG
jgi:hypothetical protein